MYRSIQQDLQAQGLTIADVVAIAGVDEGILRDRPLPKHAVIKSGSLNAVSTISGALPTPKGVIWFAVLNGGADTEALRSAQEKLLGELLQQLGGEDPQLPALQPDHDRQTFKPELTRLP